MKFQLNSPPAGLLIMLSSLCLLQVPAAAFHDGGSSRCATCHVMHGTLEGQVVIVDSGPLLLAATSSDLCLTCHGADGVFGQNPLAPPPERGGGNFVFLLEDNINDASDGDINPIAGQAAGHSIISLEMGTSAETRWLESPGGFFPSDKLTCTSCHDPHGNASFRMLNGIGPIQGGIADFTNPAPEALGIDITDQVAVETDGMHTAYLSGMSSWCANCHGSYHDEGLPTSFDHPGDDTLNNQQISIYNRYNGDSNSMGGSQATAYLKDVPFEQLGGTTTSTAGPSSGSRIMCLSCHRAHASSAPAAARWDMRIDKLDSDGTVSGSYPIPNPYGDPNQGTLCRKCHPKGQQFIFVTPEN